jgi:ADP-ribose pyrophosphatase YjhB (NUDIX family)
MEEGESLDQAVCREAREEAMAELRLDGVLGLYSIPRISQVQVMYRAELLNEPSPGPESLEVAMFAWQDIPWTELAFPSVRWALEDYDRTKTLRVFPPAMRTAQS